VSLFGTVYVPEYPTGWCVLSVVLCVSERGAIYVLAYLTVKGRSCCCVACCHETTF
jgi:hypothetical protein